MLKTPSSIIGFIFAFFFFFLSNLENLYIHHVPNLFYYIDNATKWLKIKLQHFIDVSNPIWYLFRSDSKSSFIKFFFILKHDFYVITIWMHYTLFISVFRKAKVNYYCYFKNFPCIRFFEIIYVFQVWFNYLKVFFDWYNFISITITFMFDIIVVMIITYSEWFVIIFFLNYFVF